MGKGLLKQGIEILFAILISAAGLEGLCYALGFAPGMEDFVQAQAIRQHLTVRKPKGEIRIFTYGESTMHGAHYAPHSSPATWLELYLKKFLPDKSFRVVNFARLGQGIDYTAQVFEETLVYKPDIAIFYNGHNDFLFENRFDQIESVREPVRFYTVKWLEKSRLISHIYRQIIKHRMRRRENRQDRMGHEVIETPLSAVAGTYQILRTDTAYRENLRFFRDKVQTIAVAARRRGVRVLFLKPISNLKDFAPLQSAHMKTLPESQLREWEQFWQAGQEYQAQGSLDQALENFQKAYALDGTYAELAYRLGQIYFAKTEYAKARRFFEEARDNDAKPVRATTELQDVLTGLAHTQGLELLDVSSVLSREVPSGILGLPVIEDNVHFSVRGQALAGREIALALAERGWIAPKVSWQFAQEPSYEAGVAQFGVNAEILTAAFIKVADYFGNRFEERILYAQKAVELSPQNPSAIRALAWAYWLSGRQDKAAETYHQLKQIDQKIFQEVKQRVPEIQKIMVEEDSTVTTAFPL